MNPEFRNEAFTDFNLPANQEAMKAAIAKVRGELGKKYPLVINGEKIETADLLVSTNPSNPKEVIGSFSKANTDLAEQAMKSALTAFDSWKNTCPKERARFLLKAAAIMRRRKHELSAWMILEIGKSWAEADGDVAEAIDFCDFYAREMLRLSEPQPVTANAGEENELYYIPLGVGLVIPPWNFPLALLGSKEVGLRINELAAKPQKGQLWIKRVVAEMGGKDSIIVDSDCDLDIAAEGIVAAAFGFQGQKCSACSRAIIDEKVYDQVVAKVVERTRALKIGSPEERTNNYGPVSSKSAYASILEYVEIGKKEGKVVAGGNKIDTKDGGFYIEPTVVSDVDPEARISLEEIFGPVLAIIKAKDFDHALAVANNTEFGLTGAVYSRNRQHLERARREFHVGNLYLNRKCTGALVGVHPFGGFNMSGTDSKAGGRDYLLLFTQAKSVAEKF